MQQIVQCLKSGKIEVADIPCPQFGAHELLIQSHLSLISAGTERMLLEFGRANWIDKAKQQPEKVQQVLHKIKNDGLLPTLEAVRSKLDQPLTLGYCNVGTVINVGKAVTDFAIGDRVVSNSAHAEYVISSPHLAAKVPPGVSDSEAAFTPLAAIALQSTRLAMPTLGETFAVFGLGLIGLLTVQCLKAQGCHVIGLDFDPEKLRLASAFGATTIDLAAGVDPSRELLALSKGVGIDGAIIATSTQDNSPIHQAAQSCRKRGRIILVGTCGMEFSRSDFYQKELSFQVSCSYGPGRYDEVYEKSAQDYPLGFVRWTLQRNFSALLQLMNEGKLSLLPLITHRFSMDDAKNAYDLLASKDFHLGILLDYTAQTSTDPAHTIHYPHHKPLARAPEQLICGFIGAGNYASRILLPLFKQQKIAMGSIASRQGVSAFHAARKFKIAEATSDPQAIIDNPVLNPLIIATRHDTHAHLVCQALRAGKHLFVEKPLAISHQELNEISSVYASLDSPPLVMVGFNRRFSPLTQKIKALLATEKAPKVFMMTVNAGFIPADHWTQHSAQGGRIIGEACHFVDLLCYLSENPVMAWQAKALSKSIPAESATIQLQFADGSLGTIHYLANGHSAVAKERLEIFCNGKILQMDNFCSLQGYGWPSFKKMRLFRQDKGQSACIQAFMTALTHAQDAPIPFDQLIMVAQLTLDINEALHH